MSSTCSSRFRIRCVSRALALSLTAVSLCGPAAAPLTVAAFLSLVDRRYFDGSTWHRVVPNFVVRFFITHSPQPHLDGTYTVFGRVVSGLGALDAIGQGERLRSIHR